MNNKIKIGLLILSILWGAYYIQLDDAKFRIDEDRTSLYLLNDNSRWELQAREFVTLFDGTSRMNRNVDGITVSQNISGDMISYVRTTPYIRGPVVIERYLFNATEKRPELFPIEHNITVYGAKGKFIRYELEDMNYKGPTRKLSENETVIEVNKRVKATIDEGFRWAWIYKSGTFRAQYDIDSDTESYSFRLYDPPALDFYYKPDDLFPKLVQNYAEFGHGHAEYIVSNPMSFKFLLDESTLSHSFVYAKGSKLKSFTVAFYERVFETHEISKEITTCETFENVSLNGTEYNYSECTTEVIIKNVTKEVWKPLTINPIHKGTHTKPGKKYKLVIDGYWDQKVGEDVAIEWIPHLNIKGTKFTQSKWAWWNTSYDFKRTHNLNLSSNDFDQYVYYNKTGDTDRNYLTWTTAQVPSVGSIPIPINSSSGFALGNDFAIVNASEDAQLKHDTEVNTSDLIGWWSFDGSSAIDDIGKNDGNLDTTFTTGKYGQGLQFDGSSGNGDVTIPNDASLDTGANEAFTVLYWLKKTTAVTSESGGLDEGVIVMRSTDAGLNRGWQCYFDETNNGLITCGIVDNENGGGVDIFTSTTDINADSNFHHIALVRNTSGNIFLYVDGSEEDTSAGFTQSLAGNDVIVGNSWSYDDELDGIIDEPRIYARALSASEISDLYGNNNTALYQKDNNATGLWDDWINGEGEFWDLNKDVLGSSSNSHDGTNNGATPISSCKYGGCYSFDGIDDYISVGTWNPSSTDLSFGGWYYLDSLPSVDGKHRGIIAKADTWSDIDMLWQFEANFVADHFKFENNGDTTNEEFTAYEVETGKWVYFVLTHDDDGNDCLYIDGISQECHDSLTFDSDIGASIQIGATRPSTEEWKGDLDGIFILPRVLSADEIKALYQSEDSTYNYLGAEETSNTIPNKPSLNSPANDSYLSDSTPTLNVTVVDPDGDNMNVSFYFSNDTQIGSTQTGISNGSAATVTPTLPDGRWNWYANATDGTATNQSDSWTFTVDTIAPNVTATGPENQTNTSDNTTDFSFIAIDATETTATSMDCELYVNGSYSTSSVPIPNNTEITMTSPELSEGADQEWFINCSDDAGNVGESQTYLITIDVTPPTTTINDTDTSWRNESSFSVSLSCSDAISGCYLPGGYYCTDETDSCTPSTYATTANLNFGSDGTWYFRYYMNDSAGNNETVKSQTYKIDTTDPVVSITFPVDGQNVGNDDVGVNITLSSFNITADCTDTNREYAYQNETSIWANVSLADIIEFNNQSDVDDGSYSVLVSCNDSASNVGTDTTSFLVDLTNPIINYVSPTPANDSTQNYDWVYVNITFTEANKDTAILVLDDTNYTMSCGASSCNYNATGLSDGTHWFYVFMNDTAGNTVTEENRTMITDATDPIVESLQPANGTSYQLDEGDNFTHISFNVTATDNIGLDNGTLYIYYENGTEYHYWVHEFPDVNQSVIGLFNGSISDINRADDTYGIIVEDNTKPAFDYRVNFTGVDSSFTSYSVSMEGDYVIGNPGHIVNLQMYNFSSSSWITCATIPDADPEQVYTCDFYSGSDVVSDGTVMARLYHPSSGNQNHEFWVDIIGVHMRNTQQVISLTNNTLNTSNVHLFNGTWLFNWLVYDSAGNYDWYDQNQTIILKEDATPPNIDFVDPTPANNTYQSSDSVYINVSLSETPGEIYLEWDGVNESMNQTEPDIWFSNKSGLSEDVYVYKVHASDSAENWNVSEERTLTIDSTTPNTTINDTDSDWRTENVSFSLSCTDNVAGCDTILYCIDIFDNCTANITYSSGVLITDQNTSYVRFQSNDSGGNLESIKSQTYKIDYTDPATTSNFTSSNYQSEAQSISLACTDLHSGCNTTEYCIDTSDSCTPTTDYSSPFSISDEGVNYLRFNSTDTASNVESINSQAVKIDLSAPQYSEQNISHVNGSAYDPSFTYEFNITWDDIFVGAGSGVDTVIFNFDGTNYSASNVGSEYYYDVGGLAGGSYTYYWWANDTVGNVNTTGDLVYLVDTMDVNLTCYLNGTNDNESYELQTDLNFSCYTNVSSLTVNLIANISDRASSGYESGTGSATDEFEVFSTQYLWNDSSQNFTASLSDNSTVAYIPIDTRWASIENATVNLSMGSSSVTSLTVDVCNDGDNELDVVGNISDGSLVYNTNRESEDTFNISFTTPSTHTEYFRIDRSQNISSGGYLHVEGYDLTTTETQINDSVSSKNYSFSASESKRFYVNIPRNTEVLGSNVTLDADVDITSPDVSTFNDSTSSKTYTLEESTNTTVWFTVQDANMTNISVRVTGNNYDGGDINKFSDGTTSATSTEYAHDSSSGFRNFSKIIRVPKAGSLTGLAEVVLEGVTGVTQTGEVNYVDYSSYTLTTCTDWSNPSNLFDGSLSTKASTISHDDICEYDVEFTADNADADICRYDDINVSGKSGTITSEDNLDLDNQLSWDSSEDDVYKSGTYVTKSGGPWNCMSGSEQAVSSYLYSPSIDDTLTEFREIYSVGKLRYYFKPDSPYVDIGYAPDYYSDVCTLPNELEADPDGSICEDFAGAVNNWMSNYCTADIMCDVPINVFWKYGAQIQMDQVYIEIEDAYPQNLSVDIGDDGTYDYEGSDSFNISKTVSNATALESYVNNSCSSFPCDVPIRIYTDGGGDFTVDQLNVDWRDYPYDVLMYTLDDESLDFNHTGELTTTNITAINDTAVQIELDSEQTPDPLPVYFNLTASEGDIRVTVSIRYGNVPLDPKLDIGDDGTWDWEYSGELSTDQEVSINETAINNYFDSCTVISGNSCDVPFVFSSSQPGTENISNISMSSTLNPIDLDTDELDSCSGSGSIDAPVNVTANGSGELTLYDLDVDYYGTYYANMSASIEANGNYTSISASLFPTFYYSPINVSFPHDIYYFDLMPQTENSTDVEPYGQNSTVGIFEICSEAYDHRINISLSTASSLNSCVSIEFDDDNSTSTVGTNVSTSTYYYLTNMSTSSCSYLWAHADFSDCDYSTYRYFDVTFYFDSMCWECVE